MTKSETMVEPCIVQAVIKIEDYIEQTTGVRPAQEEIAAALTRYFVLKEISEFIEMSRTENS